MSEVSSALRTSATQRSKRAEQELDERLRTRVPRGIPVTSSPHDDTATSSPTSADNARSSVDAPSSVESAAGVSRLAAASRRVRSKSLGGIPPASPTIETAAGVFGFGERASRPGFVESGSSRGVPTSSAFAPAAIEPSVLPPTRNSSEVEPPKRSPLVSVDSSSSSSSNMFLTSWEGSLPWYNYDPTKGGDDLRQIIKASGYLTKQGNVPDLKKRSINGAILTYNKERDGGSIGFIAYGEEFKKIFREGATISEKAATLSIKLKTDRDTKIEDRTPVVSLLSKGDTLVGICKSTCANSEINRQFFGGDDKSGVRIICAKNENIKVVKILFFPSTDGIGQLFFNGGVEFNKKGDYVGAFGSGSLLRKRKDGILEVITGSFQGDRIIKHEDLGGTFSQYTNNGAGNYRLVGMASGNVSWEFKFPLTKEFNPNKQNLTFVNWNFGDGVKNIAKPDIYAHKSKSDRVLCTAFDVNDGRFMFVTKQKYNETENDLIKDIVGTLLKFKFTRNSETFCIELILNDSAVSGDDISETELENVAYLRVYTLNTTTTVKTNSRRGFFSNETDDNTVHKKILAIKMKGGNITSMGLSTVSAANDDIGTQPRESYGKIYTLDDKTGKKWEIVDSVSKTFPLTGNTIFNKCDALQKQVKGDFEKNINGVKKCYSVFYRDITDEVEGVFNAAIKKLNTSPLLGFPTTSEHTYVYGKLKGNISRARFLTENVLKAAWNVQREDVEQSKDDWNIGKWGVVTHGEGGEHVIHPSDYVIEEGAAAVSERPLERGGVAMVTSDNDPDAVKGKLVYLNYMNYDHSEWNVLPYPNAESFEIEPSSLTLYMTPSEVRNIIAQHERAEGDSYNSSKTWNDILTGKIRTQTLSPPSIAAAEGHAASVIKQPSLSYGCIAKVNDSYFNKKIAGKHVYIMNENLDGTWGTGGGQNIPAELLTFVVKPPEDVTFREKLTILLDELNKGTSVDDAIATAKDNWLAVSRDFSPDEEGAAAPVTTLTLEVGGIAKVNNEYPNESLRNKHVFLTKPEKDDNTWTTFKPRSDNKSIIEPIDKRFLTPVRSKAGVGDARNMKQILAELDSEAAAAAPPPAAAAAPVTTVTLEEGGIAKVNNECPGPNDWLRGKHVYLKSRVDNNTWETWQNERPNSAYIDQQFLTPILSKHDTGDGRKIIQTLAELDREAAAGTAASGGRRGTRKYRGRRGNGANMRRRLTRKAKGQAGGGGRRGSGSGGPGSKRRGGKMYRKTMKHVRRGRGGRKGRKGHRRTIKKYHRR